MADRTGTMTTADEKVQALINEASRNMRDYAPAPEPSQEPLDDAEPDFDMTGRCEWCLAHLPSDMLCRCPGSLEDLRAERAWLRYEEDKER